MTLRVQYLRRSLHALAAGGFAGRPRCQSSKPNRSPSSSLPGSTAHCRPQRCSARHERSNVNSKRYVSAAFVLFTVPVNSALVEQGSLLIQIPPAALVVANVESVIGHVQFASDASKRAFSARVIRPDSPSGTTTASRARLPASLRQLCGKRLSMMIRRRLLGPLSLRATMRHLTRHLHSFFGMLRLTRKMILRRMVQRSVWIRYSQDRNGFFNIVRKPSRSLIDLLTIDSR